MLAEIWDWIKTLVIAFVIVFLIQTFVLSTAVVKGQSMNPTLDNGQWLIANKIVYLIGKPKIGDIVVLENPNMEQNSVEKYFVKRVVGVPGDRIEIKDGYLYRNGTKIEETYTSSIIEGNGLVEQLVPEGAYFVMGDNRKLSKSLDSRQLGVITESSIIGRIDTIIWPLSDFSLMKRGGVQ